MSIMPIQRAVTLDLFAEPMRTRIRLALELVPDTRNPSVRVDSQSPWIFIDQPPGPQLVIWMETGEIYEVGSDGAVSDDPVNPWGFICEDCGYFTTRIEQANAHSDAAKHSLARCPMSKSR